jgi:RimJ/RimL family protein N-acetyltransferase
MPVLRLFDERDVDELVEVQREGAVAGLSHIFPQDAYPFPSLMIRQRWLTELADPEVDCYVVVHDGRVAGFAATRQDEFLHFGTAVSTWGTGLAGQAHDEVIEHLRDRGYVNAWLRVFEENQRAVRFYLRRGWTPTNVTSRTGLAPNPTLRRYELALT